ncbi:MAG: Gfo/Idh/MocA family oxidoreductase [Candidatus Latescibacteria bacterium]|nr:Gfo/Idh/MocA family oxidoreductase [Candidatus Latescibacterota bacterium]
MADKYRAVIAGCGSMSHGHALGYQSMENVEVVAIADPVAEARANFGERYRVKRQYEDFRQMLDEERPDIVSIVTWHRLHAPMTIAACARRPKAVLCEKPMSVSLGDCDEMIVAARRNEVKLAIAHQRRFNPAWNEARKLIKEGAIGRPRQVVARGGQGLLNDCSHLLDMMRYVQGDVEADWVMGNVERKTDRYERDIRIEDRSAGIIHFNNGALGLILQELDGPNYQGGIFYGSEGTLELDEQKVRLLNSTTGKWEERVVQGEDPSVAQARELVEWIEGKTEHRGRAENGRAAVEIIMAIYESARMHEVVSLPLKTRTSPIDLMVESGALPVERPGRYDIRAFLLRGEAMKPGEV